MSGKVKVWGNVVTVEWADPIEDPDPDVMAKVNQSRLLIKMWGGAGGTITWCSFSCFP